MHDCGLRPGIRTLLPAGDSLQVHIPIELPGEELPGDNMMELDALFRTRALRLPPHFGLNAPPEDLFTEAMRCDTAAPAVIQHHLKGKINPVRYHIRSQMEPGPIRVGQEVCCQIALVPNAVSKQPGSRMVRLDWDSTIWAISGRTMLALTDTGVEFDLRLIPLQAGRHALPVPSLTSSQRAVSGVNTPISDSSSDSLNTVYVSSSSLFQWEDDCPQTADVWSQSVFLSQAQ
eukprot:gnl/Dysnectes_brevis/4596_a6248_708.p1 GENE.gnl/Dysnectes_brevis/4596_a6248_708~~gnl/Dysnectes_brevis/4596_a6248_708.p1  ORF type:complete len:232 (-),score=44.61 gnl/Dysnectes_brevis/4596_a6248_708:24-719(-)